MEKSRRQVLKVGTTAAGGVLLSGISAAQEKVAKRERGNRKIRLRGTRENPISVDEIEHKKDEVLKKAAKTTDQRDQVLTASVEPPEGSRVIAYHCELVDGVPREWVGTVGRPSSDRRLYEIGIDEVIKEDEKRIKNNADIYGDTVGEDPQAAKMQTRNVSVNHRTAESVKAAASRDFDDWKIKIDSSYDDSSGGNECVWLIDVRKDPDNPSDWAMRLTTDMYPDRDDFFVMRNDHCKQKFDFNTSRIGLVEDWEPKNSVGNISNSASLSLGSDGVVTIGTSSSTIDSELDYNDKSYRPSGKVKHKTEISGDLSKNTVVLHQSASLSGVDPRSGTNLMDPTLISKARFNQKGTWNAKKVKKDNYRVYWKS